VNPRSCPPTDWAYALSLAAALEAALPDIPEINTIPLEPVVVYRPESNVGRRDMRQIGNTIEIEDVEHDPQSEGILDLGEGRWPSGEVFNSGMDTASLVVYTGLHSSTPPGHG
jgi:hypothetical protein